VVGYGYDAAGNRTQLTYPDSKTVNYDYDPANRMTSVDSINYTWDANGNLLHDGLNTYNYDQANRLISMMSMPPAVTFTYNGLGDRMQQTYAGNTTTYLLDIASGLTQVLADGSGNTYIYGLGRIGEEGAAGWQYHHGDALGSVRQLTDLNGAVTLAKNYRPYGDLLSSAGRWIRHTTSLVSGAITPG
jgi:YD repeat-containing protein